MTGHGITGYDVIGDVHGHADALTGLLHSMGYRERSGAWRHPARQAVFVGDLIDRGPQQLETIAIVRRMVDRGTAHVVLGNHEFNAIAYATPTDGGHLRSRSRKHRKQHAAFIAAVGEDSSLHRELVDWFMTIPLWLELDGLRVVHACWSEPDLEYLRTRSSDTNTLDPDLVADASTGDHPAFDAIEAVLKGPEVRIPDGITFHDKGSHTRTNVRLTWWNESATNWRDLLPPGTRILDADGIPIEALPDRPIPDHLLRHYTGDVPVIFGHYWFEGPLVLTNPLALCVDYSAGAGGPLAAYRFDGEATLRADKLVSH
jgi:Calcineurin-like phosphoesterase